MTTPDAPLNPELVDELISADLDGELAAAATDVGLDLETARAAMAAPDARARRAELERARSLLAAPAPLDATRARDLVAQAIATADARSVVRMRPRRSTQAWRVVAGVAATAAGLAGVVAIAGQGTQSGSKSSSAPTAAADSSAGATTPGPARAAGAAVEFGDVSHADALQAAAQNALRRRSSSTKYLSNGDAAINPGTQFAESSKAPTTRASAATAGNRRDTPSRAACIASVRRAAHLAAPLLSGLGTSGGRPVFVIVFPTASGRRAFVVSAADCSVLTSVPLT